MTKGLEALEILKFEMVDNKFFQKHELYLPKYENDYNEILKDIEDDEDYQTVEKELKALEFIKKCFYVAKSSGAILRTDYGFEHEEELKEVLL